jgi:rfaE bifunctional protein nucleotidyltransferase chain/domain
MHKEYIESKIFFQKQEVVQLLNKWKFLSKKIVFSNGCFDLIHLGHIDYLSQAADLGDVLVIGLNTDRSVSEIKGSTRPVNNESSRAFVLASFSFVNAVILFDESTPYELIKFIQPDVLVKGSDYKPEQIVGYDIVKTKGGEVKTINFLPGYSTTLIEQKIVQNHTKAL